MSKKKNPRKNISQIKAEPTKKESKKKGIQKTESGQMANFVLVFLTIFPFVFSRTNIDPVLSIRYTFIGIFAALCILYFFAIKRSLISRPWPLLLKAVFIVGITYGVWNFIGLTQAVNKQQVYFGLARHFLNMILLFFFSVMAEREEDRLQHLFKILCIVAIIHTIIGLGQFYDTAFTDIPGNFRPYGLMANRNLFGTAQVMLIPFCIYVLYKSSVFWKAIASLALTGIAVSSIISQTRSSWLSAITMLVVCLVCVFIFSKPNRKKWVIGTLTGIGIAFLLALLLIASDTEGEFSNSIKERSGIFADKKDSSGASENVSERIKIWKKTLEVIKDKPIIGVGMENWKVVVPKYGTKGLLWEKGFYIPDSTHNDYLLVTAESGIPGALLYYAMWILIVIAGFKLLIRSQSEDRKVLAILMLAGIAGLSVDSLFSFPMQRMEHMFYLYLMGGILLGLYSKTSETASVKKPLPYVLVLILLLVAGFNAFLGFKKMSFEKYMGRAKSLEEQKLYPQAIREGNKAKNAFVNLPPNGFPVEAYVGLSQKQLKNYPEALKEMDASIKLSPYNKALYVNKGTVYTDMSKFDSAIIYFKKGLELTPKMDIIYFNLAVNYFQLKDYKSCLEMLNKADISKEASLVTLKQQVEAMLNQQKPKP